MEQVTLGEAVKAAIDENCKIKVYTKNFGIRLLRMENGSLVSIGHHDPCPLSWDEGTVFEIIRPKMRLMTIKEICEKFDEVEFSSQGTLILDGKHRIYHDILHKLGKESSTLFCADLYIEVTDD